MNQGTTYHKPQKIKGTGLVIAGLVFGLLQALATMPSGGGLALLTALGGVLGFVGMLIMATKNPFTPKMKKACMLGAVLFLVTLLLAAYQASYFVGLFDDVNSLDEDIDEVDENNWEEQRSTIADRLDNILDGFMLVIVLLALSTCLLAVAATLHLLIGGHQNRMVAMIPLILFIVTVLTVTVMTNNGLSDTRDFVDDVRDAESDDELADAAEKGKSATASEVLAGSKLGGVLNLVNLIVAMFILVTFKPDVTRPMHDHRERERYDPYARPYDDGYDDRRYDRDHDHYGPEDRGRDPRDGRRY
jgi:hypothetical protein